MHDACTSMEELPSISELSVNNYFTLATFDLGVYRNRSISVRSIKVDNVYREIPCRSTFTDDKETCSLIDRMSSITQSMHWRKLDIIAMLHGWQTNICILRMNLMSDDANAGMEYMVKFEESAVWYPDLLRLSSIVWLLIYLISYRCVSTSLII